MSAETQDTDMLKKHVEELGEYFDSVIIFCTRHDPEVVEGGTVSVTDDSGNWFAARGQVAEWIVRQDERTRQSIREQ